MRVDPTNHPCYANILAVSAAVLDAERDVDGSIVALSKLMATTIEQYADAKLPAFAAQSALARLTEALTANVDTRRLLGEAHKEYGRTAKMLGATAEEWGPGWPCYTVEEAIKPKAAPLRRVA
ncbi:hypothetical protein [Sphingomonas bacterium]|uniref:hypothetical protein n=1 Tax=Sphingomonas bacterium TaxID=1895847 RepID=UPI002610CCD5|nr:hypothetical protein [Sphingomonas bacterium]MDB5679749.1 hypothetical protein [Sphingomonas bacterium]